MRCLASLRVPSNEEDYEAEQVMRWRAAYPAQTEDIDDRLQLSKNAKLTYSDELNTLILECLNWIPHQRILPDALIWNINLLIGAFKAATTPDEAHGFDQRDVCKNFWQAQNRTTDVYEVGMSFKPLDLEQKAADERSTIMAPYSGDDPDPSGAAGGVLVPVSAAATTGAVAAPVSDDLDRIPDSVPTSPGEIEEDDDINISSAFNSPFFSDLDDEF